MVLQIACVSPAQSCLAESLQTLRYALRVKEIRSTPLQFRLDRKTEVLLRLKREVEELKLENEMLRSAMESDMMRGGMCIIMPIPFTMLSTEPAECTCRCPSNRRAESQTGSSRRVHVRPTTRSVPSKHWLHCIADPSTICQSRQTAPATME